MNQKSLRILEFNKIKDKLKKYANSQATHELIDELYPYENIYEVNKHLQETMEAFKLLTKKGYAPFQGVCDIRQILSKASKGFILNTSELLKVANMLRCSRMLKNYISHKEEEESYEIIENLCSNIVSLKSIEDNIFDAIVNENEVSDKASNELYSIRKSLKAKLSSIKDRVGSLIRKYSKYLQENLYTIRGERYVLPVRAEYKSLVKGLVHDQSSSGATLFIEPMELVNLNNEIKELKLKEKNEIERILALLSKQVYDNVTAIKNNSSVVYELDFIFAKAKYGNDINGAIPRVSSDRVIDLVTARHPLIPQDKVVANDIYLNKNVNSLVITGPNTGGKTVTLKTVGLLEVMALSGLMIPARENSTIGFFKEIFADIGDEQSIEQSLSTFSSHMTNIVNIINKADENSLVLFDELGAGTDPTEGAALAISILDELKNRNSKVIATTHYSELKVYALKTEKVENASVEFDVNTLKPTYHLLIGIPGKSNAFEISKRLGLPEYIIKKSRERITKDTLEFEELIQSLQDKTLRAERELRESQRLKKEAEEYKNKYEQKLIKLKNTRERIVINAQREARRIIREAKLEVDDILKNIRELERRGYDSKTRQDIEEQRKKLKNKMDSTNEIMESNLDVGNKIEDVKEGQEVFIQSLNQNGIVISKPNSKKEVLVEVGMMKVNVKLDNLRTISKKMTMKDKKKTGKEVNLKFSSVKTSIDLRGMDSLEAVYTCDKYLDDASMAGLNEVTIIHGKGTGVLRNSISTMLKKNPHVKQFRLGEYGEGGTGVTIVTLK